MGRQWVVCASTYISSHSLARALSLSRSLALSHFPSLFRVLSLPPSLPLSVPPSHSLSPSFSLFLFLSLQALISVTTFVLWAKGYLVSWETFENVYPLTHACTHIHTHTCHGEIRDGLGEYLIRETQVHTQTHTHTHTHTSHGEGGAGWEIFGWGKSSF